MFCNCYNKIGCSKFKVDFVFICYKNIECFFMIIIKLHNSAGHDFLFKIQNDASLLSKQF